jgi:hypothetical protein
VPFFDMWTLGGEQQWKWVTFEPQKRTQHIYIHILHMCTDMIKYVYIYMIMCIYIYVHMYICICIQIHHTSIIHIDKGYPFSHLTWNILRTTWPQTWTDVFETPTIGHVWSIF